jgi:hypothetical protein
MKVKEDNHWRINGEKKATIEVGKVTEDNHCMEDKR